MAESWLPWLNVWHCAGCVQRQPLGPDLLEDGRRLSGLLLRQADLRSLSKVVLETDKRRAHAKLARSDLGEIVVARLDPELHGIEWIGETNRRAQVVAIELFLDRDVGHLHR